MLFLGGFSPRSDPDSHFYDIPTESEFYTYGFLTFEEGFVSHKTSSLCKWDPVTFASASIHLTSQVFLFPELR